MIATLINLVDGSLCFVEYLADNVPTMIRGRATRAVLSDRWAIVGEGIDAGCTVFVEPSEVLDVHTLEAS